VTLFQTIMLFCAVRATGQFLWVTNNREEGGWINFAAYIFFVYGVLRLFFN